jgi:hypothetical protein
VLRHDKPASPKIRWQGPIKGQKKESQKEKKERQGEKVTPSD